MPLYGAIITINLAFALGVLAGYLWWERDVDRLRAELEVARVAAGAKSQTSWSVKAIVRAVNPQRSAMVVTHEPLPGLMGAMTMEFPVRDVALLDGLQPGDRVTVTVAAEAKGLTIVTATKDP